MASIPYLALGPTAILSFLGLLHGEDPTVPTPAEDWRKARVDILIPAQNEEQSIVLCLNSIARQNYKPWQVTLVDDGSSDRTYEFAIEYSQQVGLDLHIVRHPVGKGKTMALKEITYRSEADVIFVLDGDTVLRSENFLERIVQELYQGIGIACASGVALPLMRDDRKKLAEEPSIQEFAKTHPSVIEPIHKGWFNRAQQKLTDLYREELYLFLQKFIYHSEMVFFGTIIHPVGCAVAYRRKYLKDAFDTYHEALGGSLTVAEDNFLGFAFADYGYRNIQMQDIYVLSQEPLFSQLPKQLLRWSSAFLQSCYYFNDLITTPLKSPRALYRWAKNKITGQEAKIRNVRKISEAYRQAFGTEYTKKYGRPIGWYVFLSAFEKLAFPFALIVMLTLSDWEALAITAIIDISLFCGTIVLLHKNRRIRNFFKSLMLTPIRYLALLFDVYVIINFIVDLILSRQKEWKI